MKLKDLIYKIEIIALKILLILVYFLEGKIKISERKKW